MQQTAFTKEKSMTRKITIWTNKFIFKSWSEFFVFQSTQSLSWINLLTC